MKHVTVHATLRGEVAQQEDVCAVLRSAAAYKRSKWQAVVLGAVYMRLLNKIVRNLHSCKAL